MSIVPIKYCQRCGASTPDILAETCRACGEPDQQMQTFAAQAAEVEALRARIAELEARQVPEDRYRQALQNILDGNYPHAPRNGKCAHDKYSWECCENCVDDYIASVLAAPSADSGEVKP